MKHILTNTFLIIAQMLVAVVVYGQSLTCNTVYEAQIQANGLATIVPSDVLEGGSNPTSNLTLSISTSNGNIIAGPSTSVDVSCYPGSTLTYQVTHTPSNNSCWGNMEIVDPNNHCTLGGLLADEAPITFSATSLSGPYMQAVYLNGQALRQYDVNAFALNINDLAAGINTLTFDGISNSLNGVTTLDQVLIQRHLTDVADLSPIASIRADVDRSEFLGSDDLVELRRLILGQVSNTTKYFALNVADIPADFDEYDFPGLYDYTFDAGTISAAGLDFEVHQPGDVNFSSNLRGDDQPTDSRSTTAIYYDDRSVRAGTEILVPLTIELAQGLAGLQLALSHDQMEIIDVETAYDALTFDHYHHFNSTRLNYLPRASTTTFEVVLRILPRYDGLLSDGLLLDSDYTQELVTQGLQVSNLSLLPSAVVSTTSATQRPLTIAPTILIDHSVIHMPTSEPSTVYIYNTSGQLSYVRHSTGLASLSITRDQLPQSGHYIVQVITSTKAYNTRLIVL